MLAPVGGKQQRHGVRMNGYIPLQIVAQNRANAVFRGFSGKPVAPAHPFAPLREKVCLSGRSGSVESLEHKKVVQYVYLRVHSDLPFYYASCVVE
jgi:hypothetical protein